MYHLPHSKLIEFSAPHFTEISKSDYSLSMRILFIIPLVLMSLVSFPSWGLTLDDLVERGGVFYKKFTDIPFTGELDEKTIRGSFKDGREEGSWVMYWDNGKLMSKGEYKNGRQEGLWKHFKKDGSVWKDHTGTYKNGVKVSD